ncbi:MAG TPA: SH3 domain-containing protein [Candidatus Deferrimicrobium sp.]|nr:SH3 domain-containing protein [Candidatus Deferrimicrobium sp.]
MLGPRLYLLPVCLLHVVILLEGPSAGAAENRAVVAGAPTANLRAGAGVDHALQATLKEGDQVNVEKLEGEWYQVTAVDGQTGYIHKNLLKLGGEEPAPVVAQMAVISEIGKPTKESISTAAATPQAAVGNTPAVRRSKPQAGKAPAADVAAEEPSAAAVKSPSILQMLEGHEDELMIAAAIAAVFFFVGWICGGNYSLRRDRKRRNQIRF